jgi:hypothetical protein
VAGKSAIVQIQPTKQILEKAPEYGVNIFHFFINLKTIYDSIIREKLLKAVKEFEIPQKLIVLVTGSL